MVAFVVVVRVVVVASFCVGVVSRFSENLGTTASSGTNQLVYGRFTKWCRCYYDWKICGQLEQVVIMIGQLEQVASIYGDNFGQLPPYTEATMELRVLASTIKNELMDGVG